MRFTNKQLNLLHNNSAQMLTRQDVKYCSAREFDSTFQFYQASLLVARSKGKLLLQNWKCFIPVSGVFIPLTGSLYYE